jgi:hypothetical protein
LRVDQKALTAMAASRQGSCVLHQGVRHRRAPCLHLFNCNSNSLNIRSTAALHSLQTIPACRAQAAEQAGHRQTELLRYCCMSASRLFICWLMPGCRRPPPAAAAAAASFSCSRCAASALRSSAQTHQHTGARQTCRRANSQHYKSLAWLHRCRKLLQA